MKFVLLLSLVVIGNASAAGGSGHGSPMDLIPSFVNVGILLSILVWKLKTPLKNFFQDKSKDISSKLEVAASKAKEAEALMAEQKKKNASITDEVKKIETGADEYLAQFGKDYTAEVSDRITRLKEDADQKVSTEKSELIAKLNSKLIDSVVSKTKAKIKADKGLSDQATNKILEGIK